MIRGMQRDGYVIRKKYQMGIETDMHGVLQRETRGLEAPMYMERRTHIHTQRKNEKNEHRASETDFERHIATSRNKYGDTEEHTHTHAYAHIQIHKKVQMRRRGDMYRPREGTFRDRQTQGQITCKLTLLLSCK